MILSDNDIIRYVRADVLNISPFDPNCVQPNSYDLHLHRRILLPKENCLELTAVPDEDNSFLWVDYDMYPSGFLLGPGRIALCRTEEVFRFPNTLAGRLEGVSSNGRVFLRVHVTAGFFDAGFEGSATIEMKNDALWPIKIKPAMRIGQMSFETLSNPATRPYSGRYKGQVDPTPALQWRMSN